MKKNKTILLSIFIALIFIIGAFFLTKNKNDSIDNTLALNNVNIIDGKQIITINAKGGYAPQVTIAQADIPTIIKMDTRGTFDCSSALVIPSLNYRNNLPPSGETLIDVPPQKAGTKMQGLCAMGMYSFSIEFN